MRTVLFALLALLALGCAAPEQVTVDHSPTKLTSVAFEEKVDPAEDLMLFNGDQSLVLGGTRSDALQVFEPGNARTFNTLPSNFGSDFSSTCWENDDTSFGCIAYQKTTGPEEESKQPEKLVFAMYTRKGVDQETVDKTVARYTDDFGPPTNTVPGRQVQYWFWIRPRRWLMVNTAVDTAGKSYITVALGAPQIMRELRMAVDLAREDQHLAIERLSNNGK